MVLSSILRAAPAISLFGEHSWDTVFCGTKRTLAMFIAVPFDASFARRLRSNRKSFWVAKSTENRPENGLERACRTKLAAEAVRRRFRVDFGPLGVPPGAPGRPFRPPGSPLGALWVLPGGSWRAPGGSLGASWAALWRSWGAPGPPEASRGAPGSIFGRFWLIFGPILVGFRIDFPLESGVDLGTDGLLDWLSGSFEVATTS